MHKNFFIASLLVFLISACAPRPEVIIVERPTISVKDETEKIGGVLVRIVQSGDTLYSIAFANGLDVNELARWNEIADTSRLNVGQRIRLTKPIGFVPKVKKTTPVVVAVETVNSKKKPVSNRSQSQPALPKKTARTTSTQSVVQPLPKFSDSNWSWPLQGNVIERFSIAKGQQGVAIAGQFKQKVNATKGGEVVYVGDGLKGYGNLVIIKHSEHYLSAYAHNQQTYVSEGQIVQAGVVIGAVGLDKQRRNALHFQIRKDGKPVNPLSYLPAR